MPDPSYTDRVKDAHASGHLFAHMFEDQLERLGVDKGAYPLKNLFKVMAGVENARYQNTYRHNFPTTEHGIMGLATTALKKEFPVPLFTTDSYVGILMDSAHPLLVNRSDGTTKVKEETLVSYAPPDRETATIQDEEGKGLHISLTEGIGQRMAEAKSALQQYWQSVHHAGWQQHLENGKDSDMYYGTARSGMNEVNVAAKIGDVCGIIVNKERHFGQQINREEIPYKDSVKSAVELRDYLQSTYPKVFKKPLPIMSYEISRALDGQTPKLIELSPKRLEEISNGEHQL